MLIQQVLHHIIVEDRLREGLEELVMGRGTREARFVSLEGMGVEAWDD